MTDTATQTNPVADINDDPHTDQRVYAPWHRRAAQRLSQGRDAVKAFLHDRAELASLTGRHVDDFTPRTSVDARIALRRAAQRTQRPATIASWAAVTVFGATAFVTAPAAATWQPETVLHKLTEPDTMVGRWITQTASVPPLLALLLWLAAYGLWLTTARDITRYAQHGRYAPWIRLALALITITGAAATYLHAESQFGTPAAFLAVGVVLVAWRALAVTTARQAHRVRDLNILHAHATRRTRDQRTSNDEVSS
ncbi:MAG: hypothetical protein ABW224_13665 [Kibdelosporangium sp.]